MTEIVRPGSRFGVLRDYMLKRAMPIFGIVWTTKISMRTAYALIGLGWMKEVYLIYSPRFYGIFAIGQFHENAMIT
jgi:hypothetical protein